MTHRIGLSAAICLGLVLVPLAAEAETCGLPSGDYVVFDGSEQIGSLRIGQTRSGLVMDGTVGGDTVSYRIQTCAEAGVALMIPNHQSPGPNPIYLSGAADAMILQYQDEAGQWADLTLVK